MYRVFNISNREMVISKRYGDDNVLAGENVREFINVTRNKGRRMLRDCFVNCAGEL